MLYEKFYDYCSVFLDKSLTGGGQSAILIMKRAMRCWLPRVIMNLDKQLMMR